VLEEHAQKRSGLWLERRSQSRGTHSVEVKVELVEP